MLTKYDSNGKVIGVATIGYKEGHQEDGTYVKDIGSHNPNETYVAFFDSDDISTGYLAKHTDSELAAIKKATALIGVRRERNKRLAATDWTQLPDVPEETRNLYTTYRQELRDLPSTADEQGRVIWPSAHP